YMTGIGDTSNPYKKMGTVIQQLYEVGKIRHSHPATFPVQLPAEYIKSMTNQGDVVIDCFGGSGTTLIACEQLNRKARLMELSPEYCQVIINRWETFTGQKAIKIN
uniref:DNA methyltransferase n=1 Tax=Methanobrevibacter sp. TaxID=66852 RepID=UPI00388F16C9